MTTEELTSFVLAVRASVLWSAWCGAHSGGVYEVLVICIDSTSRQRPVVALPDSILASAVWPQVQIGRV